MKILFTFENPLPSTEANAEVFVATARYLTPLATQSWLHVPASNEAGRARVAKAIGVPVIRAFSPLRPAVLRHFCCGLTLVLRREFRQADLVYTRNLWVAWLSVLFRQRVVFDHYRPWSDQVPPLQYWLYRLVCSPRFLVNICHSEYTLTKYLDLGVAEKKLQCVHNGFEPRHLHTSMSIESAKQSIGVDRRVKTVVYTGRVNHRKGLDLVIAVAKKLPDILFILVGSEGQGPIEKLAKCVANVRIVPWQPPEALGPYICAADCLLIPPSSQPLVRFGSTVLPLKLFFYMACGRPIIAGDTADVREILRHEENAYLCRPDRADALVAGINALMTDETLRRRLGEAALADSRAFTWSARAHKIAGIIAQRLKYGSSEPGTWGSWQRRVWRRQSRCWLFHLIRNRSWVLPPAPEARRVSTRQDRPPSA